MLGYLHNLPKPDALLLNPCYICTIGNLEVHYYNSLFACPRQGILFRIVSY